MPMTKPERVAAIVGRAEQLDTGEDHCFDPVHPSGERYWTEGVAAFQADIRIEACPYEAGAAQDDWLRGWMAAELIEFGRFDEDA